MICLRRSSSFDNGRADGPSQSASSGFGCVSIKIPAIFVDVPANAKSTICSLLPLDSLPFVSLNCYA